MVYEFWKQVADEMIDSDINYVFTFSVVIGGSSVVTLTVNDIGGFYWFGMRNNDYNQNYHSVLRYVTSMGSSSWSVGRGSPSEILLINKTNEF